MEISEFDFEKICRVCKQTGESMRSIFENDCPRIDEMLMACTTIIVDIGDGLPESLCLECSEQLHKAYKFKQLCEGTDISLREYLNSKNDKSDETKDIIHDKDQETHEDQLNITAKSEFTGDDSDNDGAVSIHRDADDPDLNCITGSSDYIKLLDNNQLLLTCRSCASCFTTLDGLKCHKRLHTGKLFKCNECGKQYTRRNHLNRHELTHKNRKLHVCKICNKTLTRLEHLKRHLVTHLKEKPFACTTCNRTFNRVEHLNNHVKRCKGDFVHVCDICNKGFNREDSLEVHKCIHNNKLAQLPTLENLDNIEEHYLEIESNGLENTKQQFSDEESESSSEIDNDTHIECLEPQVCIGENDAQGSDDAAKFEAISDVTNLEEALGAADNVYAEFDSTELSEEKFKIAEEIKYYEVQEPYDSPASVDSEYLPKKKMKRKRGRPRKYFGIKPIKPAGRLPGRPPLKKNITHDPLYVEPLGEFRCPESECTDIFTKMSLLEKHIEMHDDKTLDLKLHTCKACNKSFARANHLKRHLISHSEVKPFKCEFCSKCFNRRDHLNQHLKLHSRTEQFECDVCKKTFDRESQLVKHKATKHEEGEKEFGEKRYQCGVCLKNFTTLKYRDIHMKGHMGDKSFVCRTCDKSFVSRSHLTEHMKFHNEDSKKFLCSECGQRFIRNDYLVIHMRRHRGEKPFKCKFCGKGFPRTTDLTVHERYHTGEKTHLCTICGRGFGRAYNLTVHMRIHTGEKPYQCTYCEAAFAQGNDLKAHIRRHTGERFHCELCNESFLMGYLLTHHKRTVHGLNIVSNIRRLNSSAKAKVEQDEPPLTVVLPPSVVSSFHVPTHLGIELIGHKQE